MTSALVLRDDTGAVRVLTMNRPEKRNALSPDLIGTLYAALRDADDDPSVRAVVLTGAAPVIDPALAAEQAIAGAQTLDRDGLKDRYTEISARNRRQTESRT